MTEQAWVACTMALLLALASGCDCSGDMGTGQPPLDGDVADGSSVEDGSVLPRDGSASPRDGSSREEFCAGSGPLIRVEDGEDETCTGTIATRVFRQAICTCEDLMIQGLLKTDAFDSEMSMSTMHGGAAVGVNRNFQVAGAIDIGGSFTNSPGGESHISFVGVNNRVRGDLSTVPPLHVAGGTEVERDLIGRGAIDVQGRLQIARDLALPSDANMTGNIVVSGTTRRTSVDIPVPCDCSDRLDIAGIVAAGIATADDGFDREALSSILGPNQTIEIPCGRFDISQIQVRGGLTLRIHGRTALFIDGPLEVYGSLDVDLGETGELDIFVAGSLSILGNATFGSPSRPAAVRIYVAENVNLAGGSELAGNLYAPNATVTPQGTYEIYGSLFVNRIHASGGLTVHYDRAILRADEECDTPPPPEGCSECDECGRQSCIDGECGPCQSDSDCCAPLVCLSNGTCGPLLF